MGFLDPIYELIGIEEGMLFFFFLILGNDTTIIGYTT